MIVVKPFGLEVPMLLVRSKLSCQIVNGLEARQTGWDIFILILPKCQTYVVISFSNNKNTLVQIRVCIYVSVPSDIPFERFLVSTRSAKDREDMPSGGSGDTPSC